MLRIFTLFGILLGLNAVAQDSLHYQWKLKGELALKSADKWNVDVIGNIYVVSGDQINKYDSTLRVLFSQSVKSFGEVAELEPINTMKLVVFSTEQQTICILDNTLTLSEDCLELGDFDIGSASHIAVSGQPDKIWVMDQLNSKLLMLSLTRGHQLQEVKNIRGILNMENVLALEEIGNRLYLYDENGSVYIFDIYGSLVNRVDFGKFRSFDVTPQSIIGLDGATMQIYNLLDELRKTVSLPLNNVEELRFYGNFFYFRTQDKIYKYQLSFQ